MLPQKFIFCHIPKVAGTLFGQILDRNFGKKFYPYYGLWDNRFFTKEDVAGMCDLHPQYQCLASHMFTLQLSFESERFDFRAITFLRDPVERPLSLYFCAFRMAKMNPGYKPPGSVDEFFHEVLEKKSDGRFFNDQFRFLCGGGADDRLFSDIEKLAGLGKLVIAPVDRFDDACLLLEQPYPEHFKNMAYARRSNVAERKRKGSEELRERSAEVNQSDLQLFTPASAVFEREFKEVFNNARLLEQQRTFFGKRSARQAHMHAFKSSFKKIRLSK